MAAVDEAKKEKVELEELVSEKETKTTDSVYVGMKLSRNLFVKLCAKIGLDPVTTGGADVWKAMLEVVIGKRPVP